MAQPALAKASVPVIGHALAETDRFGPRIGRKPSLGQDRK